jgi:hypothetical protein
LTGIAEEFADKMLEGKEEKGVVSRDRQNEQNLG